MKILIFNWQDIKNPFGGGAEVHLHEIFKLLVQKGYDITLFSCRIPEQPSEEIIDGIKIIRRGARNLFNFVVPYYYFKIFRKGGFDLIIDDINKIPFYTPLYIKQPLMAISHHFFGKSIFHETGLISGLYVYISEFFVNLVYKKTKFVVVSQSTLDEFIHRGFNVSNFDIIYNAISQKNYPMKVTEKSKTPIVSYFGRIKKYKSIDHLLYAFAKIHHKYPDALLYLLGRGDYMPQLQSLAKKLGIESKTKFFGFVTEEEKVELLSKSYCVVNTSMKEGWGITNIEANACGTPIISANVPGLKDSVCDGKSGLLYEYGDTDTLAEKIDKIFSDEQFRNKLSLGSIEWANEFSWELSAEKMKNVIDKFCKTKN